MSSFKQLYWKCWKDTNVLVSISVSGSLWCGIYDSSTGSVCKPDLPGRGSDWNASPWIFVHIFQNEKYSYCKLKILVISTQSVFIYVEVQHFSLFQTYNTANLSGRSNISIEKMLVFSHNLSMSPCNKYNSQSYKTNSNIHFNAKSLFKVSPWVSHKFQDNEVTYKKVYRLFKEVAFSHPHTPKW